jgi:hypothetical protein
VKGKDLTGQRFGRLVALRIVSKDERTRRWIWEFKCDCGELYQKVGSYVTTGHSISCGCYAKDVCKNTLNPKANMKAYGESARRVVYLGYKHNAKKRGIVFEMLFEDFARMSLSPCVYCGEPPSKKYGQPDLNGPCYYSGIDRVDNNKGYIKGNCVSCCHTCNMAKRGMSVSTFIEWAGRVYKYNMKKEII